MVLNSAFRFHLFIFIKLCLLVKFSVTRQTIDRFVKSIFGRHFKSNDALMLIMIIRLVHLSIMNDFVFSLEEDLVVAEGEVVVVAWEAEEEGEIRGMTPRQNSTESCLLEVSAMKPPTLS